MQRRYVLALALLLLPCTLLCGMAQDRCSDKQTNDQIDRRIDGIISKLTLPERIAQLQDQAPAIPRVGIPAYNWWSEGLHGAARDGYATVFPQAIGLAATWDPALLREVGDAVGVEAHAKFNGHGGAERQDTPRFGGLTLWSPNVNIFRDPRWGRGQETYGEDPFLTATLGLQFVQGLQGSDPFYLQADATPKHFLAHSGPEKGRDSFNAVVSKHDLADTYTPAFHALLTKGHAAALMCSYNAINGVPSCANGLNLQSMVRDRWGFQGYVVSDCDAVGDITDYHHYTADNALGAAAALHAGVDLNCGNTYGALAKSVAAGLTTEAKINRALHRLLLARVRLGMLDPASCSPYAKLGPSEINSPAHKALALRAAEESIVLLKNNGVLPVPRQTSIAVVGPTADMLKVLEANYHGTAMHPVTSLDGLRSAFANVAYASGSLLADGVSSPIPPTALQVSKGRGAGLTAEYFDAADLQGPVRLRTVVRKIDLDFDRVGPAPKIPAKHFAARWTGLLVPPAAGEYVLRVNVERCWDCTKHDAYRLIVDSKTVLDNHGEAASADRVTFHFVDTEPHSIQLELLHTGDDEGIALEWIPPASALLDEAERTTRNADVIFAFVGLSPDLEGEALSLELSGFDGGDRTSLALPAPQQALLDRLHALGKPVVVVLNSGSAVSPGAETEKAAAMLEAWYPGEAGGDALAAVLTGSVNPSGRLPVTFYRSVSDLPAFTDYSMLNRTYRYFRGPVLYPFGYGRSYSHFTYGPVQLSPAPHAGTGALTATVSVRNDGPAQGMAVAELYLQPPQLPGAPRLMLEGLQRIDLLPGASRVLRFAITPEQMSTVDDAGTRTARDGRYHVYIKDTQPDILKDAGTVFRWNHGQLQP